MTRELRLAEDPDAQKNSADSNIAVTLDFQDLIKDPEKLPPIKISEGLKEHFGRSPEVTLFPGDQQRSMITSGTLTITQKYKEVDGRIRYVVRVNVTPNHGGRELKERLMAVLVPASKNVGTSESAQPIGGGRTLVPMEGASFDSIMLAASRDVGTGPANMVKTLSDLALRMCQLNPPCWSQIRGDYALIPDHAGVLYGESVHDRTAKLVAADVAPRIASSNAQLWRLYRTRKWPFARIFTLFGGKPAGLRKVPEVPEEDIWKDTKDRVHVAQTRELVEISVGLINILASLALQVYEANEHVKQQLATRRPKLTFARHATMVGDEDSHRGKMRRFGTINSETAGLSGDL